MRKIEIRPICVSRLEKGLEEGDVKVVFECEGFGEYPLEIHKSQMGLFIPGEEYTGHFLVSGIPDFVGEKDAWENICTVSYKLEKVLKNHRLLYGV